MVLSLACSSLLSIAAGIKDGRIRHPHFLPPKLRQRVLDTVLERNLLYEENCMDRLSSVEFLTGMESLSTEFGHYSVEFMYRLEESMATMLPNGETVGASITKLNLSIYGCRRVTSGWYSSFPYVTRLIAQCPNTASLALRSINCIGELSNHNQYYCGNEVDSPLFPSVLNKDDVCDSVMENLVDLSLRGMKKVLPSDGSIINFKRLMTLKLNNCSLQMEIWPDFLRNISTTLQNLHMIDVIGVGKDGDSFRHSRRDSNHMDAFGLDWILPISMPKLQSLEIVSIECPDIFECNKVFVDNLGGCQKLRRVHLTLDGNSTDEVSLVRLASMNIDLIVKARLSDCCEFCIRGKGDIYAAIDSSSRFKLVRIFNERIDSFELGVFRKWSPQLTTALEDAIKSCSNLTTFGLRISEIESSEKERINAAMLQYFGVQGCATQLKDLRLSGNIDEDVILAAFDCCFNLNRLEISNCPAVRDQHLIDWVSIGGGKMVNLKVRNCQNISSEGIIPILAKSAEGLLRIDADSPNQGNVDGRNWKTMLSGLCPFAKSGY